MTTIIKTKYIVKLDLTQAVNHNVPVQAEVEGDLKMQFIWLCIATWSRYA